MRLAAIYTASATLLCLSACASTHPDHFYALEPQPAAVKIASPSVAMPISLKVTLPSLVDRNELVLRDGSNVTVLEHERWAAPLADQVALVLGQDIEQRRPDVIISRSRLSQAGGAELAISVDIVDLSASRSGSVSIEARWRIERAGDKLVVTGRESFNQPGTDGSYSKLTRATSACVAQIADRLVQRLPPSAGT